jgi:hypothetical protein
MRKLFLLLAFTALVSQPDRAIAGELKLTIQNGLVTLIADDVPLSLILAEWARIGQTKIVNGEKLTTPVTLQIVDTPERKALDIVLRSASGYMAAERPTPVAQASVFDRIMILPTSRPPANTGPINTPPSFVPRPVPTPPVPDMDEEEEERMVPPGMPPQSVPGMINQTVPGMNQPTMPGQGPASPNAPLTAPRPGPLPQPAPQQPVPFGTPPKPPGGGGGQGGASGGA